VRDYFGLINGLAIYEAKNAWVRKKKGEPVVIIEGLGTLRGHRDKAGTEGNLQFIIPLKLCKELGEELIKRFEKHGT